MRASGGAARGSFAAWFVLRHRAPGLGKELQACNEIRQHCVDCLGQLIEAALHIATDVVIQYQIGAAVARLECERDRTRHALALERPQWSPQPQRLSR